MSSKLSKIIRVMLMTDSEVGGHGEFILRLISNLRIPNLLFSIRLRQYATRICEFVFFSHLATNLFYANQVFSAFLSSIMGCLQKHFGRYFRETAAGGGCSLRVLPTG